MSSGEPRVRIFKVVILTTIMIILTIACVFSERFQFDIIVRLKIGRRKENAEYKRIIIKVPTHY